MPDPQEAQRWNGLSEWPVIASAWTLHGVFLFVVVFNRFPSEDLDLSESVLVALGLLALLVLEASGLVILLASLERWRPTGKLALAVDLFKSLLLSFLITTLGLSSLKFLNAGVHLKLSDVWFAYTSADQIFQEVQSAELLAILAIPTLSLALLIGCFIGFRRARRSAKPGSLASWSKLSAVGATLLLVAHSFSTIFPTVLKGFVPEGNWLIVRRSHSGLLAVAASDPLASKQGAPIEPYLPGPAKRPFNVVLVMLESVPWKRTFLNDEVRGGLTPNLKRLSEESVVFDRAYAASTHSCYAQLAILSSLHPRKYDHHDYYLKIRYPHALIWDALKPAGYSTALFSCQNERWGNMRKFVKTPGLDVFRHSLSWPDEPRKGRGRESKVYEPTPVAKWKSWRAKQTAGLFFTYLNFQANHFPYELPKEAPRSFEPSEIDFAASYLSYPKDKIPVMLNRFDNAQNYADQYLGEVIDSLKSVGDWDSTVLIVASDHGEAFYEHGVPTHGTDLHEEQVRSLLMMRVPGMQARRVSEPVSMLDVAPTLLEILGLNPHGNMQGRGDILELDYEGSKRPIFFTIQGLTLEDGVLMGDRKLIVNLDRETKKYFDLSSDPDELIDLSGARPEESLSMEQLLGSFLNRQLKYYSDEEWKRGFYPPRLP